MFSATRKYQTLNRITPTVSLCNLPKVWVENHVHRRMVTNVSNVTTGWRLKLVCFWTKFLPCMSVIVSVHTGFTCDHYSLCVEPHNTLTLPWAYSDFFNLDFTVQGVPWHVRTWSIWSTWGRQVGSSHPTRMLSCFILFHVVVACCYRNPCMLLQDETKMNG